MKESIRESMIYGKFVEPIEENIIPVDENCNIIMEDIDPELPLIIGVLSVWGTAVTAIVSYLVVSLIKNAEDKKNIRKAIDNYERTHVGLIKVSDMDYKVYKLKKTKLNGIDNKDRGAGKEDKGNLIQKIFKLQPKDTKPNRIVEYRFHNEPAILVAYTIDSEYTSADTYTTHKVVRIAYASKKFEKYKDYYNTKLMFDRGFMTKETNKFVEENLK